MSNTTVNRDELEFLVERLQEEFEQLHALSTTLTGRLRPNDPDNPNGRDDLVSWRIAQILEDRLGTVGCKDCWRASNIPQVCAPSEYSGNVASLD